jgi:dephospho-CoA kinase
MPVFALTGSLGSGKTKVLRILEKKGAVVLNVDKAVHAYYKDRNSSIYRKIVKYFPSVLTKARNISRSRLRRIAFGGEENLRRLESIVHPQIIKDLKAWIRRSKRRRGIYIAEVPLLFEKNLDKLFDKVILVCISKKVFIERAKKRFDLSRKEALKILSLYLPLREKIRRSDYIIWNNTSLRNLARKVDRLWKRLESVEV